MRDSEGDLLKLSTGVLPSASPLENKLNAILHGLKRSFEDNYKEVILETDNLDAFIVLKNFPHAVPAGVEYVARQIFIRINDPRWFCCIVFVYPNRNPVAIYLARLGGEKCNQLYTLKRPVGSVEELLSLDLGFGHVAPQFQDIEIENDEEDPVNFGPATLSGEGNIHGGYAFHEDFYSPPNDNMDIPAVVPIHEAVLEDVIIGKSYYEEPGDHPALL